MQWHITCYAGVFQIQKWWRLWLLKNKKGLVLWKFLIIRFLTVSPVSGLTAIFRNERRTVTFLYSKSCLKSRKITVNGSTVKANYKVQEGDEISVAVPDIKEPDILPEDIPLDILYEDDDVLIVNKPKGMVVHPSAGHTSGTLVNAIMFSLQR